MKDEKSLQNKTKDISNRVLLLVSLAVLMASSVWFSGTAAVPVLKKAWILTDIQAAWLTISVQLGFIFGTFVYALMNISDIFRASRVFFVSALLGAVFNGFFAFFCSELNGAIIFRFLTGIFLAGIYPVGMKIVAAWFRSGLGWRLGILVGALTMGTATPYLIGFLGGGWDWKILIAVASGLSLTGGLMILMGVPEGPYLQKRAKFDMRIGFRIFRERKFRLQALGYFGHMWELYAFWALSATFLAFALEADSGLDPRFLPLISFSIIGIGTLGCVLGGLVSRIKGERSIALISLLVSGSMCAISWIIFSLPPVFIVVLMLVWGFFVVSDSPQFSALAAIYCPPEYTGTALTIQNGIGFGITVISLQIIPWIAHMIGWQWAFVFLLPGPILGALAMLKLK